MKAQTRQTGPRPRPRPNTLAEARKQWRAAHAHYDEVTGKGGLDFAVFDEAESALREAEGWFRYFTRLAATGAWPPAPAR
jgi:hypothetical protein